MAEHLYITRTEFNQLRKDLSYLREFVQNVLKERNKSKWMKPDEAMEEIGCKASTLKKLRLEGKIDWKYSGRSRGVMLLRKSVDEWNESNSTLTNRLKAV